MDKIIDFSKSVYEICREHPEVKEIMKELGFDNIANPAMLNTAGRFMTIPKGAVMKGMNLGNIKLEFEKRGFIVKE